MVDKDVLQSIMSYYWLLHRLLRFGAAGAKPDAAGGCPNRWQLQSTLGSGGRKMSGREDEWPSLALLLGDYQSCKSPASWTVNRVRQSVVLGPAALAKLLWT